MTKKVRPQQHQKKNIQFQHIALFAVVALALFIFAQFQVIPWGVSKFVVPLFEPSGDKLEKIGFAKFNGLVWASTKSKELAAGINSNVQISDSLINKEYIFDFTYEVRNMKEHGYVKGATEFYAKSETLGENAIILEPWIGFPILSIDFAIVLTILLTIVLPTNIGALALLFDRQIDNTKIKIRLQTGFSDEIVELLCMPDALMAQKTHDEVERAFRTVWDRTITEEMAATKHALTFEDAFDESKLLVKFRNEDLYGRLKEFFSDFVVKEIEDTKEGINWRHNHLRIAAGARLYMSHHFTEKYSNNVTGLAYGGAAVLIVAVGIRGLKFIPAARPSLILLSITLEFTMLSLLAITLIYTEEEERMDRMLKKMEDANRSQLETLRGQQYDIHQLTNALVGQTAEIIKSRVEKAITEYMTSDDAVKKVVAEEISGKIMEGLRESFKKRD